MDSLAEQLSALSDGTRLRLLRELDQKELRCSDPSTCDLSERCCSVGELAEALEITPASTSHHLKELRRSGLIRTQKEGRYVYCELNRDAFQELLENLSMFALPKEEIG